MRLAFRSRMSIGQPPRGGTICSLAKYCESEWWIQGALRIISIRATSTKTETKMLESDLLPLQAAIRRISARPFDPNIAMVSLLPTRPSPLRRAGFPDEGALAFAGVPTAPCRRIRSRPGCFDIARATCGKEEFQPDGEVDRATLPRMAGLWLPTGPFPTSPMQQAIGKIILGLCHS